ncbi:MAG: hypothetical protein WCF95_06765 [bacterium]
MSLEQKYSPSDVKKLPCKQKYHFEISKIDTEKILSEIDTNCVQMT